MQGRRSAAERDAMPRAAEIGELPLEGLHFRAHHERRILADAVERRQDFVPQLRVLRLQIENGNLHAMGTLWAPGEHENSTVAGRFPQARLALRRLIVDIPRKQGKNGAGFARQIWYTQNLAEESAEMKKRDDKNLSRRDFLQKTAVGAGALAALATPETHADAAHWEQEADVVVVGAGATGLPAAIEASGRRRVSDPH